MSALNSVNKHSALTAALAATPVDIPKGHGTNSTHDYGKAGYHQAIMLPTPPNSISPTLPPQACAPHGRERLSTPNSIDGIANLSPPRDGADLAGGQPLSSAALEALGNNRITPAYLSQHHLPELLLEQGPLAIRYVLAHLAQTVPGFARIAPAKARRIVVAALEGKFKDDAAVEYEKVGWGRWDARRRGEPRRRRGSMALDALQEEGEEAQYSSKSGLQIPSFGKKGTKHGDYSHSYDSAMSGVDNSYDEMDMSMEEDGVDGSYDSHSESEMNVSETTEEQDWAASDAPGRWDWDMPFGASPMNRKPKHRPGALSQSAGASITIAKSRSSVTKSPRLKLQSNSFHRMTLVHGRPRNRSEITERLGMGKRTISAPTGIAGHATTGINKPRSPPVTTAFKTPVTSQEEEAVQALLAMGTSVP